MDTPRTDEKRREFRNLPQSQLIELLWDWAENLEQETREGMEMVSELSKNPHRWSYRYDFDEIARRLNVNECAPVNLPLLRNCVELARELLKDDEF